MSSPSRGGGSMRGRQQIVCGRGCIASLATSSRTTEPDLAVVESSTADLVALEMSNLADIDREVLRLRVWEELTAAEIAEVVGLSVAATEKRITRAYAKLQARLERIGLVDNGTREAGAR